MDQPVRHAGDDAGDGAARPAHHLARLGQAPEDQQDRDRMASLYLALGALLIMAGVVVSLWDGIR